VRSSTGAAAVAFWKDKQGQAMIAADATTDGVCNIYMFKKAVPYPDSLHRKVREPVPRTALPFPDVEPYKVRKAVTGRDFARAVRTLMEAAGASGASMNGMLLAQGAATLLNVFFSDPALGRNRLGAPTPIGDLDVDLTRIPGAGDTSSAFGGAASLTVREMLWFAVSQSNDASEWYKNERAVQELARSAFEAVNTGTALITSARPQ
jgi:hypothetical protein